MVRPKGLIGLMGAIGSGKSTVATHLAQRHQYQRRAFATALKHVALDIFGPLGMESRHAFGTQADKAAPLHGIVNAAGRIQTGRSILEHLGTEGFRALDPNVWVKHLLHSLDWGFYVIEDVRFPNEAEAIRDLGGELWLVTKLNCTAPRDTGHASDTAWRAIVPDRTLSAAEGDLTALFKQIDAQMERLRT